MIRVPQGGLAPPTALKLHRRDPCKTDNFLGSHGRSSSCLARLVVLDSPTPRGGSADLGGGGAPYYRGVVYYVFESTALITFAII